VLTSFIIILFELTSVLIVLFKQHEFILKKIVWIDLLILSSTNLYCEKNIWNF